MRNITITDNQFRNFVATDAAGDAEGIRLNTGTGGATLTMVQVMGNIFDTLDDGLVVTGPSRSTEMLNIRCENNSGHNIANRIISIPTTALSQYQERGNVVDGVREDGIGELVTIQATASSLALATSGASTLVTSVQARQYRVRDIFLAGSGTNFTGGDRNIQIKSGSTVYTVATAAAMNVGGRWGSSVIPFPATPANTFAETSKGDNIIVEYTGGTTDHTAGEMHLVITVERIK